MIQKSKRHNKLDQLSILASSYVVNFFLILFGMVIPIARYSFRQLLSTTTLFDWVVVFLFTGATLFMVRFISVKSDEKIKRMREYASYTRKI